MSEARPDASVDFSSERLPVSTQIYYGLPGFAGAAMAIPVSIHMTKFYADEVMIPLGLLGVAVALARAFDALTDPLMGWLTDRTRSRWGRRRPYMLFGALFCAVSFVALFSPPVGLEGAGATVWFGTSFMLYYLFHTVYQVPHAALGAELSFDPHERSRLFAVSNAFVVPGTVAAALVPALLTEATGSDREAFRLFSLIFAALLVGLYLLLVIRVPERRDFATLPTNPLVPGVRRAFRNKPFRVLLAAVVVVSIPAAIPGMLMPFFVEYVIRVDNPGAYTGGLLALYFGAGFVCLPIWVWLSKRFGKRNTLLASVLIGVVNGPLMLLVGEGDVLLYGVLIVIGGTSFGAVLFLPQSIMADIIDYDELRTGRRREAQFVAFLATLPKFIQIPSAAIPLAVLGAMGYVPHAAQSPEVLTTLRVMYTLVPAAFSLAGFLIGVSIKMDARIHQQVLEGITAHRRGSDAVDPITGEVLVPHAKREVDEEEGWFLDHFSISELRRVLDRGTAGLRLRIGLGILSCLAVSGLATAFVVTRVEAVGGDVGPAASFSVVVAGLAFTAVLFHSVRWFAARRIVRKTPEVEVLRHHLRELETS